MKKRIEKLLFASFVNRRCCRSIDKEASERVKDVIREEYRKLGPVT